MSKLIIYTALILLLTVDNNCQSSKIYWWKERILSRYDLLLLNNENQLFAYYIDEKLNSSNASFHIWDCINGELKGTIDTVPFSPSQGYFTEDGNYLLCPETSLRFVDIYDLNINKFIRRDQVINRIRSFTIHPDGLHYIVISKDSNTVVKYNIETGGIISTSFFGSGELINCFFSKNCDAMICVWKNRKWEIYNLNNFNIINNGAFNGEPNVFDISNDLKFMLTQIMDSIDNYSLAYYSIDEDSALVSWDGYYKIAYFSSDQDKIIASKFLPKSNFSKIEILDYIKPNIIQSFQNYYETNLISKPKNNILPVLTKDNRIQILDINKISLVNEIPDFSFSNHYAGIKSIKFSKDGKYLISGDEKGIIKIWGVDSGDLVKTLDISSGSIYSMDTRDSISMLAVSTVNDGAYSEIHLYLLDDNFSLFSKISSNNNLKIGLNNIRFLPKRFYENSISGVDEYGFYGLSSKNIYKHIPGSINAPLDTTGNNYQTMELSPDGNYLAVGSKDKYFKVFQYSNDIFKGEKLELIIKQKAENSDSQLSAGIMDVEFSSDFKYLSTISYMDYSVKLWHTEDFSFYREFRMKDGIGNIFSNPMYSIFFNNSQGIITSEVNGYIRFWDINSSSALYQIDTLYKFYKQNDLLLSFLINSIDIHPNGKLLAIGDGFGNLILFDISNIISNIEEQKNDYKDEFFVSSSFPNPAKNYLNAIFCSDKNFDLEITDINVYDLYGGLVSSNEKIKMENLDDYQILLTWDCSDIPKGVYFINIKKFGQNKVIKVVVKE